MSAGVEAGVRLGLGKQAQDDHFTNPELITRRLLESEIQANEDEERRARREVRRNQGRWGRRRPRPGRTSLSIELASLLELAAGGPRGGVLVGAGLPSGCL